MRNNRIGVFGRGAPPSVKPKTKLAGKAWRLSGGQAVGPDVAADELDNARALRRGIVLVEIRDRKGRFVGEVTVFPGQDSADVAAELRERGSGRTRGGRLRPARELTYTVRKHTPLRETTAVDPTTGAAFQVFTPYGTPKLTPQGEHEADEVDAEEGEEE